MSDKDLVTQALDFDPIGEAEKELGADILDHPDGVSLSLAYIKSKRSTVKRLMESTGDVHDRMRFSEYCKRIENFGFDCVYKEEFLDRDDNINFQHIYWHPEGFLLEIDSYRWGISSMPEYTVNSANVFYNMQIEKENIKDFYSNVSSGCFETYDEDANEFLWSGQHDARDALKHKLNSLRKHAQPLSTWKCAPSLHLSHYGERVDADNLSSSERTTIYDKQLVDKISKLPEQLKDMLLFAIEARKAKCS